MARAEDKLTANPRKCFADFRATYFAPYTVIRIVGTLGNVPDSVPVWPDQILHGGDGKRYQDLLVPLEYVEPIFESLCQRQVDPTIVQEHYFPY